MSDKVYVLRSCKADGTSHGGFRWPESGPVEAPDWDAKPECGHGLHGLLWGIGNWELCEPAGADRLWKVVEVNAAVIVDLAGKVKFPRGVVVYSGVLAEAHRIIAEKRLLHFAAVEAETKAKATNTVADTGSRSAASNTGDRSAASNTGYGSAASNTGYGSAASNTGYGSAASNTGDYSAASNTGSRSAASNTGYGSAASNTGSRSAASNTGSRSAASNTGDYSAASNTGSRSAASNTGKDGVAAAFGLSGRVMGGPQSVLILAWWDDAAKRKRVTVAHVGEGGIEPGVWYEAGNAGAFRRCEKQA